MARSRLVVVTSCLLAVVLGLLGLVGWAALNRLWDSQDDLDRASRSVASYTRVQEVVADEVAAEAAHHRAPGEVTRTGLLEALDRPAGVIRRSSLEPSERSYLLVLQDRYATQVRLALEQGSPGGDAVAGPTLVELRGHLEDGQRRALDQLALATGRQQAVVGRMTWRAPLALLLAAGVLTLCWRLLVRYGSRATARAHHSEQLAMRDPLTGLGNRRAFESELAEQLSCDLPDCAVILLDLDGFKAINDTWGHDVGDQVLTTVAERLCSSVRTTDLVARIGGDEFAVLARPARQAEVLRERIAEAIARPVTVSGVLLHPSASVGSAPVEPGSNQSDVLRAADRQLYDVKRAQSTSGRRLGARQVSH